jgi:hypothetical protein
MTKQTKKDTSNTLEQVAVDGNQAAETDRDFQNRNSDSFAPM